MKGRTKGRKEMLAEFVRMSKEEQLEFVLFLANNLDRIRFERDFWQRRTESLAQKFCIEDPTPFLLECKAVVKRGWAKVKSL